MAEYLTQGKFAESLGISAPAISIAIKEGRVIRTVKGIDIRHPTNRYYIENIKVRLQVEAERKKKNIKKKKAKKKRSKAEIEDTIADLLGEEKPNEEKKTKRKVGRPKKSENISDKNEESPPSEEEIFNDLFEDEGIADDFVSDKTSLDLEKAKEAVKKLQIENRSKRNQLIPRTTVRNIFSKLYLIDVNELRTLGDKVATDAAAICSTDDPDCVLAINQLVEKEVFKSLAHIQRIFNDFLVKYGAQKLGKN